MHPFWLSIPSQAAPMTEAAENEASYRKRSFGSLFNLQLNIASDLNCEYN